MVRNSNKFYQKFILNLKGLINKGKFREILKINDKKFSQEYKKY